MEARFEFSHRCGWMVEEEDLSFWFNNWNEDFSHNALAIDGFVTEKLWDFWDGDYWDFNELISALGRDLVQYTIEHAPIILRTRTFFFGTFLPSRSP